MDLYKHKLTNEIFELKKYGNYCSSYYVLKNRERIIDYPHSPQPYAVVILINENAIKLCESH